MGTVIQLNYSMVLSISSLRNSSSNPNSIRDNYFKIIYVALLSLWSFPWIIYLTNPGGDPSWIIGMAWAKFKGLSFGKDIIWSYGPLGYLTYPIPIERNFWFSGVLFKIISHFLYFGIFALYFIKNKISLKHTVIIGLLAYVFIRSTDITLFPLIGLLLSLYLFIKFSPKAYYIIPMSSAAAFLSFIKFDVAIASFGLIIVCCIFLFKQQRIGASLICFFSYIISLILIWVIIGQPLADLPSYISNSLEISSGYSAGMSSDQFNMISVPVSIICWSLIISTFLVHKFKVKNTELFFLIVVLLYIFFKHGLVRNDFHVRDFLLGWSLLVYMYYSIDHDNKILLLKLSAYVVVGILLFTFCYFVATENFDLSKPKFDTLSLYITQHFLQQTDIPALAGNLVLYDEKRFPAIRDISYDKLIPQTPLSNSTLRLVDNDTIDIFPQEIDLLYYYHLNWSPRPIFQSDLAYTSKLDTINSMHFQGVGSPKYILYGVGTLDNRNPFFDEPSTLRTILCNYQTVGNDDYYILNNTSDHCSTSSVISKQNIKFGQTINIPPHNSDLLFAKIFIDYNSIGKISDLLYKAPQINVTLNDQYKYKFIFKNAQDGIFLSASNKVRTMFPMIGNYDVSSLKFNTDTRFFYDDITIEFFTMNYTK